MCFVTAAALIVGVAGAATTAYGQIKQGEATANSANYAAEVAKNNATIAETNSNRAIAAGQEKASVVSMKNAAARSGIGWCFGAGLTGLSCSIRSAPFGVMCGPTSVV